MKVFKKLSIFSLMLLFIILFTNVNINAEETSNEEIYYEESVIEENTLAGGIYHKRIKGYSKVTDPESIENGAKEAGYGSSKPLELNKYYSQQLNILEIPNESDVKLVPWGVVSNGQWTLAKVTQMAEDYEASNPGWKVVAAINGDFFDINGKNNLRYTPSGTMKVDGDMYKINTGWPMLAINNSGEGNKLTGFLAGTVNQSSNPYLYIYDENNDIIKEFKVDLINANPSDNQVALYISFYDSGHTLQKVNVENGYIVKQAKDTVPFSKKSVFGKGKITEFGSQELAVNQFAIKTINPEVLSYLKENVTIKVQYKIENELLENCDNVIGYHDNVIENGIPSYENDGYGAARLPRTLLGTREDGSIVMIVVDGRQAASGFYGISNQETAAIVQHYGMVNGYQMDGGGSATMVVLKDGQLEVVNSPSDSNGATARSDSDCILIAMQVPVVDYDIKSTSDSISFVVDVKEKIEKYNDLYIDLNGVKKQVVDGKVTFDDLETFTDYVYSFYAKVDEEYVSIVYQGKIKTPKQKPVIDGVNISIIETNGVEKYEVEMILSDPNNSITYAVLIVGENKYWANGNKFAYSIDKMNLGNSIDWYIEINYNLQSGEGIKKEKIENISLYYTQISGVLDCQFESIKSVINDIFAIN